MEDGVRESWLNKVGQPRARPAVPGERVTAEWSRLQGLLTAGLSGYFQHYTQAADLAEDLLAETMLTAWNLWPTHSPEEQSVTVWAFTIAQKVLRRRGIEPGPIGPDRGSSRVEASGPAPHPMRAEPAATGAPGLCSKKDRLSRVQREVLALKLGGELSDQEIAQVTGLRQAHVHLIIRRALEMMGQGLEPS